MNEDVSAVLLHFPEAWSRSKRQYVRLTLGSSEGQKSTLEPLWLGRKYDYTLNGNKAKVEYGENDIKKLEAAPDSSILHVRNDKGEYKFEKIDGRWVQVIEKI